MADTGTLLCDHEFKFDDGTDDRAAAITASDDALAWVTGSAVMTNNLELALTMRYYYDGNDVPEPCTLAWSALHPLTDAISPNSALGILITENGLGPYITGRRGEPNTGEDALIVRDEELP